jgi:hypothetical protein
MVAVYVQGSILLCKDGIATKVELRTLVSSNIVAVYVRDSVLCKRAAENKGRAGNTS